MEVSRLNDLLVETAPLVGAGAVTVCEDPDIWVIEYEDEPPCFITPTGVENGYILSGVAADLPPERRLELYEMLLLFNDQVNSSGGVRLGIDAPGGAVTVAVDIAGDDMDARRLTEVINAFRACRGSWRRVVEGWLAVPDGEVTQAPAGSAEIRV